MIPLAVMVFAKSWWKAGAGLLIGAALIFPVGQCSGAQNERTRAEAAQLRANARATEQNAKATEAAGGERLTDRVAVSALQQDLEHADDQTVDSGPSAARLALNCKRLRNQGVREADLAARCGPPGPGQAGTKR